MTQFVWENIIGWLMPFIFLYSWPFLYKAAWEFSTLMYKVDFFERLNIRNKRRRITRRRLLWWKGLLRQPTQDVPFLLATTFILSELFESVITFLTNNTQDKWEENWTGHNLTEEIYTFSMPEFLVSSFHTTTWEVAFGGDSISDLLNILLNVLSITLLFLPSDSYSDNISQFTLFSLFQSLIAVCFSTLDLLIFFIFFELLVIPMFIFFLVYSPRARRTRAFWYFFFYTAFGSTPFLTGIFVIRELTGSTNYNILEATSLPLDIQKTLWLLFAPAIFFKLPLCPFHLWLPEAHVEAPTAVSVFLAGILLKIGGYAYIRFLMGFLSLGNMYFLNLIFIITIISSIWSALAALYQTDLKKIVAYMSIGHMAVAVLALNTFSVSGFNSAVLTFLSHGFTSSALFILVGIIYDRYKTRHILQFSGLKTVMPLYSIYLIFFVICNIGFPGSPAFVAELLAFFSVGSLSLTILTLIFIATFIFVAVNLLFLKILYGPLNIDSIKKYSDVNAQSGEHISLIILVIGTLCLGFYAQIVFSAIETDTLYYLTKNINGI
jgi:NADH-quinone oxidoreductase subunit M